MQIGEVASFQNGYAFKSKDFVQDGKYKIIKIKELKDGKVRFFNDSASVNVDDERIIEKYIVEKEDVLFALTGDPVNKNNPLSWVGRVSVYEDEQLAVLNQRVCKLVPKKGLNAKYIYYYFRAFNNFYALASIAKGSASQANISTKDIEAMEIALPSLNIQNKIVSVLDSIEEKINQNNKINKNLMEQARILLRIYISNSEDLQFITLGEVAEINKGTYSPKEKWPFINYLDTSSVTDGVVSELQYLDTASDKVPSRARRELQKNDIVFSTVRPNQRHFGIITEPVSNMLASTGFAVIRSNVAGISNELLYLCLTENMFIEQMQQIAEQSTSTFPSIKPSDLESCKIPSFSSDQSEELNFALASIFSLYSMHQLENNSLSQLRDTLLPKLMSGEIDISDIDL